MRQYYKNKLAKIYFLNHKTCPFQMILGVLDLPVCDFMQCLIYLSFMEIWQRF